MLYTKSSRGRRGRDRMCHRKCLSPLSYELKPRSWGGVLDTTLCDKVDLRQVGGYSFVNDKFK
jgi:hypothetical protein